MLTDLLAAGSLTCPACRGPVEGGLRNAPLALAETYRHDRHGHPLQARLQCTACGSGYPVIDGIAVVFADTAGWLRRERHAVHGRADLAPGLAGFLSEAWAEQGDPAWRRQLLAVYGRGLPGVGAHGPAAGVVAELQRSGEAALEARRAAFLGALPAHPHVLDAGCGVGAGSLALARAGARVLAFDQDFSSLRLLARLLRDGGVPVPSWGAGGRDFGWQHAVVPDPDLAKRITLVAGDVLDPPLAGGVFDGVVALNLIDNVAEPVTAVRQLHGVVRPGGRLLLASPFDWAEQATARAHRLGDGIRVSAESMDPVPVLHALLTGHLADRAPELACRLVHAVDVPWVLVRHDRSAHVFVTHIVEAERSAG